MRVAFVAVALATGACGLTVVGSESGPTDAGTGGVVDASTPPVDVPTDSPADAARSDAGATFCSTSNATLCADFDDPGADTTTGWEPLRLGEGSSVEIVEVAGAPSGKRVLHSRATNGNPANLRKRLVVTRLLAVDFWVRFTGLPPADVISPIVLTPPDPPGEEIFFFASKQKSYFQQFSTLGPTRVAVTEDVWHHFAIKLAIGAAPLKTLIDASIDDAPYWAGFELPYPWPTPTTATVDIGAASLYLTQSAETWIDNLVVTAE